MLSTASIAPLPGIPGAPTRVSKLLWFIQAPQIMCVSPLVRFTSKCANPNHGNKGREGKGVTGPK